MLSKMKEKENKPHKSLELKNITMHTLEVKYDKCCLACFAKNQVISQQPLNNALPLIF